MSKIEVIMPKMGESVAEATIIKWVKNVGDSIELDETIVEIATDKVDSEIPSLVKGRLIEKKYDENDVVKVGDVIAIIEDGEILDNTENQKIQELGQQTKQGEVEIKNTKPSKITIEEKEDFSKDKEKTLNQSDKNTGFLSPLVKNIIKKENIANAELVQINGSGNNGRITKKDILNYLHTKSSAPQQAPIAKVSQNETPINIHIINKDNTEVIEMDRMRKIIAKHMVASKSISAHVTSFVEADVSRIVEWRTRIKSKFLVREQQKITYTPIIFEAIIKAIIDFPLINISVDNEHIIKHKNINIGMATALKNGNLIVPVIKNAQEKNILGLTKSVNDLAKRARENQLKPDEITGGTFTVTNVGSFGSIMGTPIINQPQVAILALGKIQKKATVIETEYGDTIGIRSKMFLSLSYDHRVVDGALGGKFLQRVADYLESFDTTKEI